jgi:hypothetical protein
MLGIIYQLPDGSEQMLPTGANHPSNWKPLRVYKEGIDSDEEANATRVMLDEIIRELGDQSSHVGDWTKFFLKPVAMALNKEDCASCEFRTVCLNAGKRLRQLYGAVAGKQKMKDLILRSFKEDAAVLALELKKLLETN